MTFRDLNKNGKMDPYEDPAQPIDVRVADLLLQMSVEEKAGLLFQPMARLNFGDQRVNDDATSRVIADQHINCLAIMGGAAPLELAAWHNDLQRQAEATRLGIPITLASDPRHGYASTPGAAFAAQGFSQWPEIIGLAAAGDIDLIEQFAIIAKQEYLAVGIRLALHPMADLATEPRWARINGTFGEDATFAGKAVAAYIRGFQGRRLGPTSVGCMVKHFPGGGPQKDGEDPHFPYGREQVYPGHHFDYHTLPFEAAFEAGVAQVMPYYGLPVGTDFPETGFAFNPPMITGLLRERYRFEGVVCADWGVLTDTNIFGRMLPARSWGVEDMSPPERAAMALEAGIDQFGGESDAGIVRGLIASGRISEARINESALRILLDKFRLGLFENPYVDLDAVDRVVGQPEFLAAGAEAQRRAITILKRGNAGETGHLPIRGAPAIYVENLSQKIACGYAEVVAHPAAADLAIIRLTTPYEARDQYPLETFFHQGSLTFSPDKLAPILNLLRRVPTIVAIDLDRAAVIPEIASDCAALLATFGANDEALLDVVFGRFAPCGKIPFELPSSMQAVVEQFPDAPHDSRDPLFPFGHGLTW